MKELNIKEELKVVYSDLETLPNVLNVSAVELLGKVKVFEELKESLVEIENKLIVEVANETVEQGGKFVKAFSNESSRAAEVSKRCSENAKYAAIQKEKDNYKEMIDKQKIAMELSERKFEAAKYKVRLLEILAGD
jgi:hypothetical protein